MSESNVTPVKLNVLECVLASAAFAGLDGFNKLGSQGERVHVPFKFSDAVRVKIRRWKRAIKAVAEEYEEHRLEVVREMSPLNNDVTQEKLEVRVAFQKRIETFQKETRDFVLPKLKLEGELLSDGKNPIPDSVLDALDGITDDTPAAEADPKEEGGE